MTESDSAAQRRARQSVRNLSLSLVACLALVLLIVVGVPRDDSNRLARVDYLTEAAAASQALGKAVVAPVVPDSWFSNSARLENSDGVQTWYVGFVTTDNEYIGLKQTFEANPSWVAIQLSGNALAKDDEIAGREWSYWPTIEPSNPPSTRERALLYQDSQTTVVLFGTAEWSEIELLARLVGEQIHSPTE